MPDFSWLIAVVGITALWLAGEDVWWGWLIALGNEILWVIYAIATDQHGFILMAVGYGFVYLRNALWNRTAQ